MSRRRVTPTATLVLPSSASRAQWLEYRRYRESVPGGFCIGSSDVPSILDLPHVDTPAHVYHAKVNGLEKEQTDAMRFGQLFEDPIAFDWASRNRTAVRNIGLVSNVDEPWRQTSLDRRVVQCPLKVPGGCHLEVKNVGQYAYRTNWHRDLVDYILAQIVDQLAVSGHHHAHYAVCVGGNTPHQGVVWAEREADLMAYIRREVNAFRENHLIPRVPPPWTAENKVDRYLDLDAKLHAERVGEIGITDLDPVLEYAMWGKRETAAKNAKKRLKLELAKLAAGKEIVKIGDERAYSYRRDGKTNVDIEALREKYPAVFADPDIVSTTEYYTLKIDDRIRKMAEE